MDLTKQAPRSPYERLGGVVWLPRIIDKARARLAGTLGDYNFAPPKRMDSYFLHKTGVDAEAFLEAVRQNPSDEGVVAWFEAHQKLTPEEKETFNRRFSAAALTDADAGWEDRYPRSAELFKGQQPTWFQILDADEGRIPAKA